MFGYLLEWKTSLIIVLVNRDVLRVEVCQTLLCLYILVVVNKMIHSSWTNFSFPRPGGIFKQNAMTTSKRLNHHFSLLFTFLSSWYILLVLWRITIIIIRIINMIRSRSSHMPDMRDKFCEKSYWNEYIWRKWDTTPTTDSSFFASLVFVKRNKMSVCRLLLLVQIFLSYIILLCIKNSLESPAYKFEYYYEETYIHVIFTFVYFFQE